MTETFTQLNDYTLQGETRYAEPVDSGVRKGSSVTRTFNFAAKQITTLFKDWIYEPRGTHAGGLAALSTQVLRDNFDDLPSLDEVRLMHEKLKDLGGNPPPLKESQINKGPRLTNNNV